MTLGSSTFSLLKGDYMLSRSSEMTIWRQHGFFKAFVWELGVWTLPFRVSSALSVQGLELCWFRAHVMIPFP